MYFSPWRLFLSNSRQGNNADPDKMHHSTVFHLGLHYLPKYHLQVYQYTKGSIIHATNFWNIYLHLLLVRYFSLMSMFLTNRNASYFTDEQQADKQPKGNAFRFNQEDNPKRMLYWIR